MALPAGEEEDKIIIKFIVIEKPSINSIRVIGNSSIRTSELLDVASSKTGAILMKIKQEPIRLRCKTLSSERFSRCKSGI